MFAAYPGFVSLLITARVLSPSDFAGDYPVFITRTRLVARYMFGEDTSGYGIGLAMSF